MKLPDILIRLVFFTGILIRCLVAQAQEEHSVIQLNSDLELFIDHHLIDTMLDTRLVLHHPVDEGPVLYFDRPWEGAFCGYCTVINDSGTFRLYYRGLPEAGKDGSNNETTCYAESNDGIHWTKPDLGIHKVMGTTANNVILANYAPFSHNFSPFLDTNPGADAKWRFKALAGTKQSGLFGFTSPDGIHWEKISGEPVFTDGIFDSQNVAFWSEKEHRYLCYFRTWSGEGYSGFRSVSRTTSTDFITWTDPVQMVFGDTPMEHLYTNQTHPYFRAPQIYMAVAARFMPNRQVLSEAEAAELEVNPKYYKDCSDVVLMTSRGGSKYDRTFMESFIRPGIGLQNWVSRSNYPALNVVQTGPNEMSIYVNQEYAQPTAHLRRYSFRLDGFSSIQAGYSGGEMITKPFTFTGSNLFLNFSASAAGEINIQILDRDCIALEGYSFEDCKTLIGNEIKRKVTWNEHATVGDLAGLMIRLHFAMKDADLYAIKFE